MKKFALTLLVMVTPTLASATPTSTPTFSALPSANAIALPSRVPPWVGGAEHVSGLRVKGIENAPTFVQITSTDPHQDAEGRATSCVAVSNPSAFEQLGTEVTLDERVGAARLDRLEETSTGAILHISDAWVDPKTKGAHLIRKVDLPLVKAQSTEVVTVYLGKIGSEVHAVVVPAEGNDPQMFGQRGAGEQIISSGCNHVHVILSAANEAHGDVISLHGAAIVERERPNIASPSGPSATLRPYHVTLSVSQLSADKDPVVSVGLGWDGRGAVVAGLGILRGKGNGQRFPGL